MCFDWDYYFTVVTQLEKLGYPWLKAGEWLASMKSPPFFFVILWDVVEYPMLGFIKIANTTILIIYLEKCGLRERCYDLNTVTQA